MSWFRRKPVDLIAQCVADAAAARQAQPDPRDLFLNSLHEAMGDTGMVIAAQGWCAPSETRSFEALRMEALRG